MYLKFIPYSPVINVRGMKIVPIMVRTFIISYLVTCARATGGSIREHSGDFVVEEIPAFEPSGVGEHVFVNLTKRDINTREVARRLAGARAQELDRLKVIGSRRLGRLLPEIDVRATERGLQFRFFLPKGAYATVVLREFLKDDVH